MKPQRPSNIIYWLDDRPPFLIALLSGLQHVCLISIGLILPVMIVREVNGGAEMSQRLVSMSMLAGAVGVVLQSLRKGPAGSGYLCPSACGPSYLAASLLALKTGGLSFLLGTTTLAAVFVALFSRVVHRLRFLFPVHVTGLIVSMVGISMIRLAMQNFLGLDSQHAQPQPRVAAVAAATLALIVGLNVWSKGKVKLFCVLIGMAFGYLLSFLTGLLGPNEYRFLAASPLFAAPFTGHPGWSMRAGLLVPALVAALCSSLKSVGDLTTCQKINDAAWVRPDMRNIGRGILADSATMLSAGLLGGMGQSSFSTNVGLELATGVTSRVIAWFVGAILVLLAFFPKIAGVFAVMPQPVIGATIMFALSFMVVAGMQIIMSRLIDTRKIFVVGLALICGLSVDLIPQAFQDLPGWIQPFFSSSLSATAVSAILLNLVFRIGIKLHAGLRLDPGPDSHERAYAFLDRQGGVWGVRRDVIARAQSALNEVLEALQASAVWRAPLEVRAAFTEESLDLGVAYRGAPLELPTGAPSGDELIADERAAARLSLVLARHYADKLGVRWEGERSVVQLHFDH